MSTPTNLISPIEFVKLVAPDKPPQFAYALLKQGLPHVLVPKIAKGEVMTGKTKPMIDLAVAKAWYEDAILTKVPRKSHHKEDTPSSGIKQEQEQTEHEISSESPYKKGQLLTYQRKPGLCTVAEVLRSDSTLVYYTTVHGDENITPGLNTNYSYPFSPDSLRKAILKRKILLDNPYQVLQYIIDSLTCLPVNPQDSEFAAVLQELLSKYKPQKIINTSNRNNIDEDDDEDLAPIPSQDEEKGGEA